MTAHVKRAFKYRFHPADAQATEPPRTFGCVRHERRDRARRALAQRRLAKKARREVARIHAWTTGRGRDHPQRLVVEDLSVRDMADDRGGQEHPNAGRSAARSRRMIEK